jgi:hypothetical protein
VHREAITVKVYLYLRFNWVKPTFVEFRITSFNTQGQVCGILYLQSHHVVHTAEKQERKKSHTGPAFAADFVTYYLGNSPLLFIQGLVYSSMNEACLVRQ